MSTPTPAPPAEETFVCACGDLMRDACHDEPFYKEHDGQPYCVLHYPATDKIEAFKRALQRKLESEDFNFQGVWFPDTADFKKFPFNADANFDYAQFSAYADFTDTQFSAKANFFNTQFNAKAAFNYAQFSADANFNRAQFSSYTDFSSAQFSAKAAFGSTQFSYIADFSGTQFSADADFSSAQFSSYTTFDYAQFSAEAAFSSTQFSSYTTFNYAQFSAEAAFHSAQFNADADFSSAQFSADARFRSAQFNAYADFDRVLFSASADFHSAQFDKANFENTRFSSLTYFTNAVFNAPVNFRLARFIGADNSRGHSANNDGAASTSASVAEESKSIWVYFVRAHFKDGVTFKENTFAADTHINFATTIFEKHERVVFHSNNTPLHPHWFVNVDARKFTFINVDWGKQGNSAAIRREIAALEDMVSNPGSLLEVVYRQLAVNAEENNRYEEAAQFRYMAMDVKRLQAQDERQTLWRRINPFNLRRWYWLLSGYGERVWQAFVALLAIWLVFAVVYWSGDATWWQPKQAARVAVAESVDAQQASARAPLTFAEALIYSAGVMTLQKPEPSAANKRAKAAVLFETILGPLQAALLALAIRRKFMR